MNIEEMRKAEQREYAREWRKKNPDKVKQFNKNYWERKVLKKLQAEENRDKTKSAE